MPLDLVNLDAGTRRYMLEEIERDIAVGDLYVSNRLNDAGKTVWPDFLRAAAHKGGDADLANALRAGGYLKTTETRKKPSGGFTDAKVPVNAPEMLAEGEYNRFYIRALCRHATAERAESLVVYRAKAVTTPRRELEDLIGTAVLPQALLDDLRSHIGVDTALGLPAGPNSGLSVRLP